MDKLTKAQRDWLTHLRDWKMPASLQAKGWPGFPERSVDLRTMEALQKRGLVENGIHEFTTADGKTHGIWWRISDAGRAALKQAEGN